jgi:diguanylate cyclase (GGDEF)-like protein/PAS domain S-box-containing protein
VTHISPEMAMLLASHLAAADTAISVADATQHDYPVIYVNAAFERLTGYRSDQILGRNRRLLHGPGTDRLAIQAADETLQAGRSTVSRLLSYRADGSTFWNEMRISPVRDATGAVTGFIAIHLDVTAEMVARREELRAATRDQLTGLASRGQFEEQLEHEIARAARHHTGLAVLFGDIDEFKSVNDTLGHLVGDGYLIHVAESLRARLRGQDTVARIGGDEFVAMVTDLPTAEGSELAVARVVADLDRAMREPFTVDGVEHRTSVSIGAAVYPGDATTGRDLLAAADAAMYARKRRRRVGGAAPGGVG